MSQPASRYQASGTAGRWRPGLRLAFALLGGALAPQGAPSGADFQARPSLAMSELHDDNLFSSLSRSASDRITRLSPGIEGGWRAETWSLKGGYTFDAEAFAAHPELDRTLSRQRGSLDIQTLATRALTLSMSGTYAETQTPAELNTTSGLASTRARARLASLAPSLAWQVGPLFALSAEVRRSSSEQEGGLPVDLDAATLAGRRRLTSRDTASLTVSRRRFQFGGDERVESDVATLGWERAQTPRTRFALEAGPRFSGGSPALEGAASLDLEMKRGSLSVALARSQTFAVGLAGALDTRSLAATASFRPLRFLKVSVAPSVFKNRLGDSEASVYGGGVIAELELRPGMSLQGEYRLYVQRGSVVPLDVNVETGTGEIDHRIITLTLRLAHPETLR